MSALRRSAKAVLRPVARLFLGPFYRRYIAINRRIDEVRDLAVRLDRHLPVVESTIESQNGLLRSAARERAAVEAELQRLRDDVASLQRQVDALLDAEAAPPPGDETMGVPPAREAVPSAAPPGWLDSQEPDAPARERNLTDLGTREARPGQ